ADRGHRRPSDPAPPPHASHRGGLRGRGFDGVLAIPDPASRPAHPRPRGLLQHVLPDAGEHLSPAARAGSPARTGHEPLLALLEPPPLGRPSRRRSRRGGGRALRRTLRWPHGERQRPRPHALKTPPRHLLIPSPPEG